MMALKNSGRIRWIRNQPLGSGLIHWEISYKRLWSGWRRRRCENSCQIESISVSIPRSLQSCFRSNSAVCIAVCCFIYFPNLIPYRSKKSFLFEDCMNLIEEVRYRSIKVLGNACKVAFSIHLRLFPKARWDLPIKSPARKIAVAPKRSPRIVWQTNYSNRVSLPIFVNF